MPVLARGAETSQCEKTVGAALVIDGSKHLRRLLALDLQARTAQVEPGLVLDQFNALLQRHGLWFPVDVSTGAQATLGGMAGNNSCGWRSIAYGNMVHNVLGLQAWLADGSLVDFGPLPALDTRAANITAFVRDLALRCRGQIEANCPKVMRRVGGYNLDIFYNQSERPYIADASVTLAHLLVGSEGTPAYPCGLRLQLAELPRERVLGVVNFPTFTAAMDAAQHLVALGPSAGELVDRTMIDLGLANPQIRPAIAAALIGEPAVILLAIQPRHQFRSWAHCRPSCAISIAVANLKNRPTPD
jgi:FAD/FMN-containing dehydrogenase